MDRSRGTLRAFVQGLAGAFPRRVSDSRVLHHAVSRGEMSYRSGATNRTRNAIGQSQSTRARQSRLLHLPGLSGGIGSVSRVGTRRPEARTRARATNRAKSRRWLRHASHSFSGKERARAHATAVRRH